MVATSRLRESDNDERFVIPAKAGIQLLLSNEHKKCSSLKIRKTILSDPRLLPYKSSLMNRCKVTHCIFNGVS
jgi:hypothetical protein